MFHPVMRLPEKVFVFDLRTALPEHEITRHKFGIGRYDEKRAGTYTAPLFEGERNIHMGIDLFAPEGTEVYAFSNGEIQSCGYNPAKGDYGHVIVTKHLINGAPLFALYGHLSKASIAGKKPGQSFSAGQILGWVGGRAENGGWVPHLHFQLSVETPETHDLPGVVRSQDREDALRKYPDPRTILGPLY